MNARSLTVLGAALLVTTSSSGCSSSGAPDTGTFAETPATVLTTDTGAYRIAVHSAPDPQPSRGVNALRLVITTVLDGNTAAGLNVDVVPWMPAMGHGSSVTPSVQAGAEGGVYTVSNVNLFMPGLWEIRIGIPPRDHATAKFEIR